MSKSATIFFAIFFPLAGVMLYHFFHPKGYTMRTGNVNIDNPTAQSLVMYIGKDTVQLPPFTFITDYPIASDSTNRIVVKTKDGKVLCDSIIPKDTYGMFLNPTHSKYVKWVIRYSSEDEELPDDSLFTDFHFIDSSLFIGNITVMNQLCIKGDDILDKLANEREVKSTTTMLPGQKHMDETHILRMEDFKTLYNKVSNVSDLDDAELKRHNAMVEYYNNGLDHLPDSDPVLRWFGYELNSYPFVSGSEIDQAKREWEENDKYKRLDYYDKVVEAMKEYDKVKAEGSDDDMPQDSTGVLSPMTCLQYNFDIHNGFFSSDAHVRVYEKKVYDPVSNESKTTYYHYYGSTPDSTTY
ncbi:MAG TPA: hypothetical protein VFU15_09425 [Bacteroidia bacterium]|nr:hypothetical protein [Bacteroidia bacterium]